MPKNSLTRFGILIVPVFLLFAGWAGSLAWERHSTNQHRQKMHAEIASIRSYEESINLRLGHYLLLPDSCVSAPAAWRELGREMPSKNVACFWVSATGADPVSGPATSPTMVIIAESSKINIRAMEGFDDSKPAWSKLDPSQD